MNRTCDEIRPQSMTTLARQTLTAGSKNIPAAGVIVVRCLYSESVCRTFLALFGVAKSREDRVTGDESDLIQ